MWLADLALRRADPTPATHGNWFEPSRVRTIDGGYRTPAVRAMPVAAMVLLGGAIGPGLLWTLRPRSKQRPHRKDGALARSGGPAAKLQWPARRSR